MNTEQSFGGHWTAEKLEILRKYLVAYSRIMNRQHFHFAYIDAFAGTGYYKKSTDDESIQLSLLPISEKENNFLEGSARIALQIKPEFEKYIFIEKDEERFKELEKLKIEFPEKKDKIILVNEEANSYLKGLCEKSWEKHRAVMFLDPFGMQIKWETLKMIAKTKAIDLWFLFPLGQAVNRLLKRDGSIIEANRKRLNEIFGTEDWFDTFYETCYERDLLKGGQIRIRKNADFEVISSYFVERLNVIFEKVVKSPRPLLNSKGVPLFLLCFAAGNKKGAPTAVKIAEDILRIL